jgi:hypothetical protein
MAPGQRRVTFEPPELEEIAMFRQLSVVALFILVPTIAVAQQPTKNASKLEVDVAFMNGSTVRMHVQSEKIDVETLYGKLTVPVKDIRFIEFGAHLPEGYKEKIETAVKKLGSSDFREREKAVAAIVELGPYSYAAAVEATRATEAEAANRAKTVVQKLQAKFQKKDLKTSTEDKIVTPSFTIAGHILTPTIKVKTEYFGDADLTLASMRTLRSMGATGADVDATIDAAKFAQNGQWMATNFQVDGRSAIVITAKGQVDLAPDQPGELLTGPNGYRAGPAGGFAKKATAKNSAGLLMGKIGENGDPFIVGARYEGAPSQSGVLYLHIMPSPYSANSSGSYDVRAARKPD